MKHHMEVTYDTYNAHHIYSYIHNVYVCICVFLLVFSVTQGSFPMTYLFPSWGFMLGKSQTDQIGSGSSALQERDSEWK